MTSTQHATWVHNGSHWQLAAPLVALRDLLRRYGYTVYDLGNTEHLDHQPPEDHTPYSETGWPGRTPYGWVTAIDIMPKAGLPSLLELGQQIERDWPAWLKYMNRPTNMANTRAAHVSRQPAQATRSSSDTGHIHISCRSDATGTASTYDPVARLRGQGGGGDTELDTTERSMLNDIHYTLTTNDQGLGAEHIRWASAMTLLQAIAARVDVDPAELEAIKNAAREGAAAAADDIVARVLAGLPEGTLTPASVEQAVRDAFAGGLATRS